MHEPTGPSAVQQLSKSTGSLEMIEHVFDELRAIASSYLRNERDGHTLQPTALVNEAFLRLVGRNDMEGLDRDRFLRIAAQTMRRVLVDHARKRLAVKRGEGKRTHITLDQEFGPVGLEVIDLVALDDAMERLAQKSPRMVEVVELRFFGGVTIAEIARAMGVSTTTIDNDWFVARAWLARELGGKPAP